MSATKTRIMYIERGREPGRIGRVRLSKVRSNAKPCKGVSLARCARETRDAIARLEADATAIALLDVNRALDSALGTPLLEMHQAVLAPALCHLPGSDPERETLHRSELDLLTGSGPTN
jgi:hypothetical protein